MGRQGRKETNMMGRDLGRTCVRMLVLITSLAYGRGNMRRDTLHTFERQAKLVRVSYRVGENENMNTQA